MQLSQFDFKVPEKLIAQNPLPNRLDSRMLISGKGLTDAMFSHLPEHLPKNTLLLMNNSRVFPGRIFATLPSGGKVEVMLAGKPWSHGKEACASALTKPRRKALKHGVLHFDEHLRAEVTETKDSLVSLKFNTTVEHLSSWLESNGVIPLPPYIKREASLGDRERYQTVYSQPSGSVAAPTAGLHFTDSMLERLRQAGVVTAPVTLHVGAGTFLPIKTDRIEDHKMHGEWYQIPSATLDLIDQYMKLKRPIIVVGTTTFRALESLHALQETSGKSFASLADTWHETKLFITPNSTGKLFKPWCASGILTNFHQPCSTLFMMMCALLGEERARACYHHAVTKEYRFYSYGDCGMYWFDKTN